MTTKAELRERLAHIPDRHEAAKALNQRRKARDTLLGFAEYMQPNWMTGKHHKVLCEALEKVEGGEIKRLLIEMPPRHGKSELASKKFPAWYLARNPEKQIMLTSYSIDLAQEFSQNVRDSIRDDRYQKLFPHMGVDPNNDAKSRWLTNDGSICIAAGVGGGITGRGAHLAIIDDPVKNREEADSEKVRETIWKWYTSTLMPRQMKGGAIILIMTRWHEEDLAGMVLKTEDWHRVTMPGIANEETDQEEALWPEMFDLKTMQHIREVQTRGGRARDWQALYQQEPAAESGTFIELQWFDERYDIIPPAHNVYMASDFAVTPQGEGRDPDWTEHGVFGINEEYKIYPIDWWCGQTTPDEWIESLLDLIKKWNPLCWFGEAGVIRRAVEPQIIRRSRQRRIYFRKEWVNPGRDKASRARPFQGMAAAGNIVFPKSSWAERVIKQCVKFPGGAHDDAFDVMSLMCRAIADAHPAVTSAPQAKPIVDRWARPYREQSDWKLA